MDFIKNDEWMIETPNGFEEFSGIFQTKKQDVYEVIFENGLSIEVSENHGFYDINNNPISTINLTPDDLIQTINGYSKPISIFNTGRSEHLYDLTDVNNELKQYYVNGILSHNCEFIGSTYTLVPGNIIKEYREYFADKGEIQHEILNLDSYEVKIYEQPKESRCYIIGCDVADGVGGDATVIKVFDITKPLETKEVAYMDSSLIPTTTTAYILAKLGFMYNQAALAIEANNMGSNVIAMLYQIYEYPNIISAGHKGFGIVSNNKIKVQACLFFRNFLYLKDLLNTTTPIIEFKHKKLIRQLESFEKHECGGPNGYTYKCFTDHDDEAMCVVWAIYGLSREILDYYYDATYTMIGLNEVPIHIRSYLSSAEIKKDYDEFNKRIEKVKKMIDNQEGIDSLLDDDGSSFYESYYGLDSGSIEKEW